MRTRTPHVVLLALAAAGCGGIRVEAEGYGVRAADGVELQAYREHLAGGGAARGVLVYIQGSEDRSVLEVTGELAGAALMGLDILLMERRGVGPGGHVDPGVARRFATKPQRVSDHGAVLADHLARHGPAGPVILMGASEGGDVAAAVAAREPRVTHLILLGSGGGMTQADELRLMVRRDPGRFGPGGAEALEAALAAIRADPHGETLWLGHPYRRWATFAFRAPLEDLLRLDRPVLLLHGTADGSVPVESARAVRDAFAAAGKRGLTYRELQGVDHRFIHVASGRSARPLVEVEIARWLAEQGVIAADEASRYVARVKANHPEWYGR